MTTFARQLSILLGAGLPLMRSLQVLERQTGPGPYRELLRELSHEVRRGVSFSGALARHSQIFDDVMLNMVRAGEAGGDLALVLKRVAGMREKSARLRGRVRTAMIYPAVVVLVAGLIVSLLMWIVIPQFEDIYATSLRGKPLPLPTRMLTGFSGWTGRHWLELAGAACLGGIAARTVWRTATGRRWVDGAMMRLPLAGGLIRKVLMVRFARTFGTLAESGVPLLEALTITRGVIPQSVVRESLVRLHDRVRDGDTLARPMEQSSVFPALVPSLIGVGEETGQLGEMCDRIADTFEEEVEGIVSSLTALLEPAMIVVLAIFVGGIVIALFLPIISLFEGGGTAW